MWYEIPKAILPLISYEPVEPDQPGIILILIWATGPAAPFLQKVSHFPAACLFSFGSGRSGHDAGFSPAYNSFLKEK